MKTLSNHLFRRALMACSVAVLGFQIPASAQTTPNQADMTFTEFLTVPTGVVVTGTTHNLVTVTLNVQNLGPAVATSVAVSFQPPKGLKVSAPVGEGCVLSHLGHGQSQGACGLGDIAAGVSEPFTFTLESTQTGAFNFSVNVSTTVTDPVPDNNTVNIEADIQ